MFRKTFTAVLTAAALAPAVDLDHAVAADRSVSETGVSQRSIKRVAVRPMLPAGLPRAHYSYRTTIIAGPPVP